MVFIYSHFCKLLYKLDQFYNMSNKFYGYDECKLV